jgi:hypothetical protein
VRDAVQVAGTIGAGLFTGGTLFAAVVEHPARIQAGTAAALAQFAPSFRRAMYMDVAAAAITLVLCVTATALGAALLWLIAGLVIGVAIPLTFALIVPTGRRIIELAPGDGREPEVEALMHRWGRLHELRTAIALIGLILVAAAA